MQIPGNRATQQSGTAHCAPSTCLAPFAANYQCQCPYLCLAVSCMHTRLHTYGYLLLVITWLVGGLAFVCCGVHPVVSSDRGIRSPSLSFPSPHPRPTCFSQPTRPEATLRQRLGSTERAAVVLDRCRKGQGIVSSTASQSTNNLKLQLDESQRLLTSRGLPCQHRPCPPTSASATRRLGVSIIPQTIIFYAPPTPYIPHTHELPPEAP